MAIKKKILFVDDEPNILSGLRRVFDHKTTEWDLYFAASGDEAIKKLKEEKINVLITDMRMPGMDGAQLLMKVQKAFPDTIRIVLSGQSDIEIVLRIVKIAHQFLSKPCDQKTLEEIIERACFLQEILKDEKIRGIVNNIEMLPSITHVYEKFSQALASPKVTTEEMASLIEQDIAMSAKILQLSNSAFFGLPRKTTSILRAVNYIGFDVLKRLTLQEKIFNIFGKKEKKAQLFLQNLQKNSLASANFAKKILVDPQKSKEAFLSGLLQNIGQLILMIYFQDQYEFILQKAQTSTDTLYNLEKEILGVSHGEVGGYLLGIWGIPTTVVDAVIYNHEPKNLASLEFSPLTAIYVANQLLNENATARTLDVKYLKSIGVEEFIPQWQEMAKAINNEI